MIAYVLIFLAALCCVFPAGADNGQLAYAYPIEGIEIDGDLSDWPATINWFQVSTEHVAGDKKSKAGDFSARFSTGYNLKQQSIYVAIEVKDQTHWVDEQNQQAWNTQDSVILYIDPKHDQQGSGPILFTAIGPHRELLGQAFSWDPGIAQASLDQVNAKVLRKDDTTIYEWQIKPKQLIQTNTSIGLEFLICDRDGEDQQSEPCFTWGPRTGMSQSAGRIGDLLLLKADQSLTSLKGSVIWKDKTQAPEDKQPLNRVRITSNDNPGLWVQVQANDEGQYHVKLPPGAYTIENPIRIGGNPWGDLKKLAPVSTQLTLKSGTDNQAQDLLLTTLSVPELIPDKGILFDYEPSKDQQIDQFVKTYMDFYQIPGASIALVKDQKLIYHRSFGLSNAYTEEPVTDNTLFEAASITKIVFAFAVNRLAERGLIDLDKPLYEYLPFEQIAHDERYKKITARHALSHQTGFPNWAFFNDDGKLDIKFYPGIKFGYSGEGFEYLGRVVAHIMSQPLEEIIMEETQKIMGFTENTYFSDQPELRQRAAKGHFLSLASGGTIPDEIGVAHSMHTEAKTFSNFMISLMQKKGLSELGYKNMLEPQIEVPADPEDSGPQWPSRYGLGFHLMNTPYGLAYGHGGNNNDFVCQFEIYQEHDLGFIVFTNSSTGAKFYEKLREYLIIGKAQDSLVSTN